MVTEPIRGSLRRAGPEAKKTIEVGKNIGEKQAAQLKGDWLLDHNSGTPQDKAGMQGSQTFNFITTSYLTWSIQYYRNRNSCLKTRGN